jgi:uncharacterized protein YdeI (YjbR/CyaY-like superfamily)
MAKKKIKASDIGMNPKVDFFFTKAKQWKEEYSLLRNIILDCGMAEELSGDVPVIRIGKRILY